MDSLRIPAYLGSIALAVLLPLTLAAQEPLPFHITYDAATGQFSADQIDGAVRMVSTSGIFTGKPTSDVYDFYRYGIEAPLYKTGQLGPIATPGLSVDFLKSDLCVRVGLPDYVPVGNIFLNGQVIAATNPSTCPFPPDTETPIDLNTPLSASGERRAIISYDAATGSFRADVSNPRPDHPEFMTALEIVSASSIFTGEPSKVVESFFDVDKDSKLFVLRQRGVQAVEFGKVAMPGLSNSQVASDLCIQGAWLGGGALEAEYLYPGAGLIPLACSNPSQRADVGVGYDSKTGDLRIDVAASEAAAADGGPVGAERAELLTTLEIHSTSGIFTGSRPLSLRGPYDVFETGRILKQDPTGFESLYLPGALAPGLSPEFLANDLKIDLTTLSNSRMGNVAVGAIPEPTGGAMAAVVLMVSVLAGNRRTSRRGADRGANHVLTRIN